MADFTFRYARGSSGYELDWHGFECLLTAMEACRRGINEVTWLASEMARHDHIWENRTGQTQEAVYHRPAEIEVMPRRRVGSPHVWGEWGVEDRPRLRGGQDPVTGDLREEIQMTHYDGIDRPLSTVDVALFLEFGTVKMAPRPWLYPAWDATKVLLWPTIKRIYDEITAGGAAGRLRQTGGRFISPSSIGM